MLRAVLCLSLLASSAPPLDEGPPKSVPPNSGVAVSPSGNLTGLVRYDDYPAEALKKGEQGTVIVLLTVNERGAVAGCVVETSSGSATLDAQTCRVLSERAKLEPARDPTGRPMVGAFRQRITWRIEESDPTLPAEDWAVLTVVTYHADGGALCKAELMGAMKTAARSVSAPETDLDCSEDKSMSDALRGAGIVRPGETTILTEQRHFRRGRVAGSAFPMPPMGDVVIGRQVLELSIAADGKVTNCREISFEGPAKSAPTCERLNRFKPPVGRSGKPEPITATMVMSASFHAGGPSASDP